MKKIMILGASATQVPLIECAKRLGYLTYVVSIPGNYPGLNIADVPIYLDTTNKESILQVCIDEKIDGICTTGTDVAVKSIGYVCTRLGLNGLSEESSIVLTDKAKMKQAFVDYNVNTAPFYVCNTFDEVYKAATKIGFPVMIKAVDQAASKGITMVDNSFFLERAYYNALHWSKVNYVIVEKCLNGTEIGVDGYVDWRGECTIFIHNKIMLNNGKTNVPVGHSMPFIQTNSLLEKLIIDETKKCVHSVNLKSSFFNMDIIISNNVPYILEIGGRPGSTCIPEMISCYTGEDYYEKIIYNAMRNTITFDSISEKSCVAGFLCGKKDGIVKYIDYQRLDICDDIFYKLDFKEGDTIHKFELGSDRIGQVVCISSNLDDALIKYNNFQNIFNDSIILK